MNLRSTETFEPSPDQVGAARRFAVGMVRGWGVDPDDVAVVVGELAANAVLHARSPFRVTLRDEGDRVLVEVADANPRVPSVTPILPDALSGRGLHLVGRLAKAWGVRPAAPVGKVIWAELASQRWPLSR